MADAFGISVGFLDEEIANFIVDGRLPAKIDRVAGVIETKRCKPAASARPPPPSTCAVWSFWPIVICSRTGRAAVAKRLPPERKRECGRPLGFNKVTGMYDAESGLHSLSQCMRPFPSSPQRHTYNLVWLPSCQKYGNGDRISPPPPFLRLTPEVYSIANGWQ